MSYSTWRKYSPLFLAAMLCYDKVPFVYLSKADKIMLFIA